VERRWWLGAGDHLSSDPLVIDVVPAGQVAAGDFDRADVVVVVEPLYGATAASAALDAGWGSVELAAELPGQAPIPLVSFEQVPAGELQGGRCRVRCDDLLDACGGLLAGPRVVLLGAPAFARPLGARLGGVLAAGDVRRLTFVAASSTHDGLDPEWLRFERVAADAWWATGALIRVLLDELDLRDAQLTDVAGIAMHLATGTEEAATHLGAGARWRRHLARGGSADDLRVARALDSLAVVPEVVAEGDVLVARAWSPA
jgi:hypothetical protein